ncbi:MAG TPA: response regulator [Gemmataceae bacterium]|nr:response regulator [Gemmataceae bacterium]
MTTLPLVAGANPNRPLRVLIADDYGDAADSLAVLLEMAGCVVRVVYDGAEVVPTAAEFEPDACVLDLWMPSQDGWDAARTLRVTRGADELLLVAVTGLEDRPAVECSLEAGFDFHWVKPVPADKLFKLLAEFAGRPRELAAIAG